MVLEGSSVKIDRCIYCGTKEVTDAPEPATTPPASELVGALVKRWREQAAEWDRGYKDVLTECADELEAALALTNPKES